MNYKIKQLKNLLLSIFILSTPTIPQSSIAKEINFIPRAWAGLSDYQFKQSPRKGALPDGSDFPEVKFDATFLMTGIGLSSIYDHFYIDFSYQDSSEEEDSFSSANFYEKFKGDRRDYSATLGMKILDYQGTIYIGYKNGKTSGKGNKGTQLTFKEDGFFIGANYGWIIADSGLLAFNIAYADLDGNLKEVPGPVYSSGLGMNADSETKGLSYGISWTSTITEKIGYSIALDANEYEFDHLKDDSASTPLPDKIEESLYTGKISIFYQF
jgi:hypothetical protein